MNGVIDVSSVWCCTVDGFPKEYWQALMQRVYIQHGMSMTNKRKILRKLADIYIFL